MLKKVFISYSRQNLTKVKTLVNDIEALGHKVWFDQELSGGHFWWDQVLKKIRECDLFIFALTSEALDSHACKLELTYAIQLQKTILPVLVNDNVSTNLLPPALSKIQYVDYSSQDKQSAFSLIRALTNLPSPQPLPKPLPKPPEVPISSLGDLKDQIESETTLAFEDQITIFYKLKERLLDHNGEVKDVLNLLGLLSKRDDLYAKVAKEIEDLTSSYSSKETVGEQSPSVDPEPSVVANESNLHSHNSEKEPDEHQEWSAELISKNDRERVLRVRLSQDVHIIQHRVTVKMISQNEDIVELDGVVVAKGGSLFSGGGVFKFFITDAKRRYPATVDVRTVWDALTFWTDLKIQSFRLDIDKHILYSEGK